MTLTEEQLEEFFDRLQGPEGIDARKEDGGWTWRCAGGRDKTYAAQILDKMGISVEQAVPFLQECEDTGGYCDCEIILNTMARLLPEEETADADA